MHGLEPGRGVTVVGLKSNADLNGLSGTLLLWDDAKQRWLVQLDDGSKKMFKGANLKAAGAVNMSDAMRDAPVPSYYDPPSFLISAAEAVQWYEVSKNMVFLKHDPHKDAPTVAIARKGQKLEVQNKCVIDVGGHRWAELTSGQLRRSQCKDAEGEPVRRGFSLIDASHMGLGVLLRGPLGKEEWPDPEELEPTQPAPASAPPSVPAPVSAPLAAPVAKPELAADSVQWFEVAKSMVFVKATPDKDARTVAIAQEGDIVQGLPQRATDAEGRPWIKLTAAQVQRMQCDFGETNSGAAFLLLEAHDLGLGELLRGPLPLNSWPERPAEPVDRPQEAAAAAAPVPDSGVQTLEVAQAEVVVYMEPSEGSGEIARVPLGEQLDVEEETFDGWARLVADTGWVRRCARTKAGGSITSLRPVGSAPRLACVEVAERPGDCCFEVVCPSYVSIRAEPSSSAQVRAQVGFGKMVWAESQRYDGWVRLKDGEGWLPSWLPNDGKMLHAPLFLDVAEWCAKCRQAGKQWAHGNPIGWVGDNLMDPTTAELAEAQQGTNPERLREAIKRSRALGLTGEEVTSAERRLEELRRASLEPGVGGDHAAEATATASPAKRAAAEPSGAVASALEALAVAAASGNTAGIRAATAAAKAAGAHKRDIARVFALQSNGGGAG